MPVIVTALLALLYPVHAVFPGVIALAAWWAYWAVKERDSVWGGCGVAIAAAMYPLAWALGRLGAAQLAAQAVFGTVDEIVASPRLLPVLLLELLWLFGYDPARRAAWRALSARAIASGNPALDYIGTGGPTPLRIPA